MPADFAPPHPVPGGMLVYITPLGAPPPAAAAGRAACPPGGAPLVPHPPSHPPSQPSPYTSPERTCRSGAPAAASRHSPGPHPPDDGRAHRGHDASPASPAREVAAGYDASSRGRLRGSPLATSPNCSPAQSTHASQARLRSGRQNRVPDGPAEPQLLLAGASFGRHPLGLERGAEAPIVEDDAFEESIDSSMDLRM